MLRKGTLVVMLVVLSLMVAVPVAFAKRGGEGGRGDGPIIYVRGQELYFDSIVTADPLPMKGHFQKLEVGPNGLETDYGPRDPQYKGGRWWFDVNGNAKQDAGDHFFNCPLLGPGRANR
jgi:hypothetical protein